MHAIKGRWVGQPFARAKSNESDGRKTRIRRSKEERKAMVEVFIKRYQESNSGSFPSLNLTHKEVGGSFYTVREIVRDIIQENRVLGPGKLLLVEQSTDQSLKENPLHSIAIEPQSPSTLISKEAEFLVNYNQTTDEEPILLSDEQCTSANIQVSHGGPIINDSLVDVSNNNDSDDLIKTDLQVNEHKEVGERIKEDSGTPITLAASLAADVVVETFPLRPMTEAVNSSDARSETCVSTSALKKQESQMIELESDVVLLDVEGNYSTEVSGPVDEKVGKNIASSLVETKSDVMEEALAKLGEKPMVESSNGSLLKYGSKHEVNGPGLVVCADGLMSVTEQGQKSNEIKAADATSGIQNLNGTLGRSIDQALKIEEDTKAENKVDAQQNGGSQKESIPTLNRINLESWEGASKNPSKPEDNPLLLFFKTFVAAFVKFWSE